MKLALALVVLALAVVPAASASPTHAQRLGIVVVTFGNVSPPNVFLVGTRRSTSSASRSRRAG